MKSPKPTALNNLAVFFAHSHVLESEAAERHRELADVMDVHNNPRAAAVFRRLAGYGDQHAAEVLALMGNLEPVRLAPWEYDWGKNEAPETSPMARADYRMSSARALQMALLTEQGAHDYYAAVAEQAQNDDVRRHAREFAAEEAQHVEYVRRWIARSPAEPHDLPDDDDPAHMPE